MPATERAPRRRELADALVAREPADEAHDERIVRDPVPRARRPPDGVGAGRKPPEFLKDGDIMETEVEGIGRLRNRIVKR